MKLIFIGILLILVGIGGLGAGSVAFGDIGIACMIGGASAFLSGIGFIVANGKIKRIMRDMK